MDPSYEAEHDTRLVGARRNAWVASTAEADVIAALQAAGRPMRRGRELRARGVVFEEYDGPGLRTVDAIAYIEGKPEHARHRPAAPTPKP